MVGNDCDACGAAARFGCDCLLVQPESVENSRLAQRIHLVINWRELRNEFCDSLTKHSLFICLSVCLSVCWSVYSFFAVDVASAARAATETAFAKHASRCVIVRQGVYSSF